MRDAIRMVFDEAEDIELVGEAANGHELLPLNARVQPDFLVLLDVQLPGPDGLACLEQLAAEHPNVRVAMLSAVDDRHVIESFRAWRAGYIRVTVNPRLARRDPPDRGRHRHPSAPLAAQGRLREAGVRSVGEGSRPGRAPQGRSNKEIARSGSVSRPSSSTCATSQARGSPASGPRRCATPTSTTSRPSRSWSRLPRKPWVEHGGPELRVRRSPHADEEAQLGRRVARVGVAREPGDEDLDLVRRSGRRDSRSRSTRHEVGRKVWMADPDDHRRTEASIGQPRRGRHDRVVRLRETGSAGGQRPFDHPKERGNSS